MTAPQTKTCPECGLLKALSDFYKRAERSDGLRRSCKECEHPQQRVRSKQYWQTHSEQQKMRCKQYQQTHSGQLKIRRKLRDEQHADERRAYAIRYRKANLERCKANCDRWRSANSERVKALTVRWHDAHPENYAANSSRRRARKRNNGVSDSAQMVAFRNRVTTAAKIRCYWCKRQVPKGDREIDHIVPLSKGGPDAEWNLCCACGHCNATKSARDPGEFSGQYELLLTVPKA